MNKITNKGGNNMTQEMMLKVEELETVVAPKLKLVNDVLYSDFDGDWFQVDLLPR